VASAMLIAFLVLSVETYLAAYTLCDFRLSRGLFGPTEIRMLLVIGSITLIFRPYVHLMGQEFLLFDVGGTIASAGMLVLAILATLQHTATLYREERLP
jgi:archaetidylinositol phosphate synthase